MYIFVCVFMKLDVSHCAALEAPRLACPSLHVLDEAIYIKLFVHLFVYLDI